MQIVKPAAFDLTQTTVLGFNRRKLLGGAGVTAIALSLGAILVL